MTTVSKNLGSLKSKVRKRIGAHVRTGVALVQQALEIGDLLTEIRELLPKGQFMQWYEANVEPEGLKYRAAFDYIRASQSPRRAEVEVLMARGETVNLRMLAPRTSGKGLPRGRPVSAERKLTEALRLLKKLDLDYDLHSLGDLGAEIAAFLKRNR